jgi:hypothetical protein
MQLSSDYLHGSCVCRKANDKGTESAAGSAKTIKLEK